MTASSGFDGATTGTDTALGDPLRRASRPADLAPRPAAAPASNDKGRLLIGRGINLSGKITACEHLVVEGIVTAEAPACGILELTRDGSFTGSAVVDTADISGSFDGTLTVRGCLFIRAGGHVSGTIRYGELEVARGGRVSGDVRSGDAAPAATNTAPAAGGTLLNF